LKDELFRAARQGRHGRGRRQAFSQDLLNTVATDRLAHVYGTFRIDRHHVQETEQSWIVSEPAETCDGGAPRQRTGVAKSPQDLVLAVRDEGPRLPRVAREIDVPCGAAAFLAGTDLAGYDPDVAHEGAVSLINVNLVLASIAGVYELVFAEPDAMGMAAIAGGKLIGPCTHAAHLAQIMAARIKDDHAVIAIAVGDVDASWQMRGHRVRIGINRDGRREVQQGLTV